MIINIGIFSPPRFSAVERVTAGVTDWRDFCSLLLHLQLKKPKHRLSFLSANTFLLWTDKGWWRSNDLILPNGLSSEDFKKKKPTTQKNKEIPLIFKCRLTFFPLHILFIARHSEASLSASPRAVWVAAHLPVARPQRLQGGEAGTRRD